MRYRLIYRDLDLVRVSCIHQELLAHDIWAELRNANLTGVFGEVAMDDAMPQVWVKEVDYAQARQVVDDFFSRDDSDMPAWQCPQCQEVLDGQYEQCWQCGYRDSGMRDDA